MHSLICVSWTGPNVSPEEMVVVQHAIAKYLRSKIRAPKVYFTHKACEGVITRGKEGIYGVYAGTFFTVDLGEYEKDKRRELSCLFPRRHEHLHFVSDKPIALRRTWQTGPERGRVDEFEIKPPSESSIRVDSPN